MVKAIDLFRQGRNEELWQMCCGYLKLSIDQFMAIQESLLLEQIDLMNKSPLGKKLFSVKPETVEEFRNMVPLTTYRDYCPELLEKREEMLPAKTMHWVHSSGKSGEYACKWVPWTESYAEELSKISYGLWLISGCKTWGDVAHVKENTKIVYTVAPPPYMTGTLADLIPMQSPVSYYPSAERAKNEPFDARINIGFKQALSEGFDCFFGLSLVLSVVGDKLGHSLQAADILALWKQPKSLVRLARGLIKSKRERRPMLPRDLWNVRGIMCGGLDSSVYKEKIKRQWGRYPLDVYAATEAGVIATQTWDYEGMTFIPSLNFLEFIPEEEHIKWRMDNAYQPKTVLLNEVKPDHVYELVLTNFRGGSLMRYRIGDMVRITALRNDKLGIGIPQMVFERRADDLIDFVFVRLTEKSLWQAIEDTRIPYEDWVAYKEPGQAVLNVFIEIKKGFEASEEYVAKAITEQVLKSDSKTADIKYLIREDYAEMMDFRVKVNLLPIGSFSNYLKMRQEEGADLAHLKPPHINPSNKVISLLRGHPLPAQPKISKEKIPVQSR